MFVLRFRYVSKQLFMRVCSQFRREVIYRKAAEELSQMSNPTSPHTRGDKQIPVRYPSLRPDTSTRYYRQFQVLERSGQFVRVWRFSPFLIEFAGQVNI